MPRSYIRREPTGGAWAEATTRHRADLALPKRGTHRHAISYEEAVERGLAFWVDARKRSHPVARGPLGLDDHCKLCGQLMRPHDVPPFGPDSDCGGDCAACMADAEGRTLEEFLQGEPHPLDSQPEPIHAPPSDGL